jgi:rhodanese-related sulfurtransferase
MAMPLEVHDRREVQALIHRGAQVVEVLGAEEFEEDHLPGAINLPLPKIETEAVSRLDPAKPVLVYCWDSA